MTVFLVSAVGLDGLIVFENLGMLLCDTVRQKSGSQFGFSAPEV